jgi:hypothetical protein
MPRRHPLIPAERGTKDLLMPVIADYAGAARLSE